MPRGGRRKGGTPDKEVEDAFHRMRQYPEYLMSARNSDRWKQFLINIGVYEHIVESESGSDFWERVRNKVQDTQQKFVSDITPKWVAEKGAYVEEKLYRDERGIVHKGNSAKGRPVLRDKLTGQFTSSKKLREKEL